MLDVSIHCCATISAPWNKHLLAYTMSIQSCKIFGLLRFFTECELIATVNE
jgi:hypothetical protein